MIQSAFFSSLFLAGFSEASSRHLRPASPIQIVFDDPNITRPAFELCIARLYGGGPELYVPPSLLPTATTPLASFPFTSSLTHEDVPAGQQLATPRFLLSLLSTSIFLSIPSLVSLALSTILRTVGPYTVLDYLRFAMGNPIGMSEYSDEVPAVGLEHVADESCVEQDNDAASDITKEEGDRGGDSLQNSASYYGTISDKIGEASTCWLARWGPDFFAYEEGGIPAVQELFLSKSYSPSSKMFATLAGKTSQIESRIRIPVIWRRSGLSARWIRAIMSSDSLFVRNERARYNLARSIVEFRRRHDGLLPEEEAEWKLMFDQSIYYANMEPEDLIHISEDISTITRSRFVPLPTLHAATFDQMLLRHYISSKPSPVFSGASPSSPPPREKELGIILSTADLASRNALDSQTRFYFRVPENSSLRLGENPQSTSGNPSMEDLFSLTQAPSALTPAQSREITSEATFFGLLPHKYRADDCRQVDPLNKAMWSPFPPLRFSVEFWDLDNLKEKMRLYSQTVWYAGSLFNVYVQCVKKKGQSQLGIYLHRQSSLDPIPPSSCPFDASDKTTILQHLHGVTSQTDVTLRSKSPPASPTVGHYSPSIHPPSRSTTPTSLPPYSAVASARPPTTPGVSPPQAFRDQRGVLSAYFLVCCSGPTGNSQTRFSSAPDVFKVSQSWGWKSSVLWGDESGQVDGVASREVSLRASIALGLV